MIRTLVPPSRRIGKRVGPIKVAIADDSKLVYSDDYRDGWLWGFKNIGCEVQVFDVGILRKFGLTSIGNGPYSSGSARGYPKMTAQNIIGWRPDILFTHHGRSASLSGFLDPIKRAGIPTAVYLCDEPYEVGETALYSPSYDYVFTMDPCTIEVHQKSRLRREPRVFYLPPGVNTDHFVCRAYGKRSVPAFFLGNADLTPRSAWLSPIERLIDGSRIHYWPSRRKGKPIVKGSADWVDLRDHPRLYADCVIGLNVHRAPEITEDCYKSRVLGRSRHRPIPKGLSLCDARPSIWGTGFWNDANLPAEHINPRFFEMAACGTLVVSDDHRSELARVFPMAPRAESPEHFLELVTYYIDHQDEAEDIGHVCSEIISSRHSYRHRAAEVLIRVGLKGLPEDKMFTSLGAPTDFLTTQNLEELLGKSSSELPGPSERWSPASGLASISTSGSRRGSGSTGDPMGW